MKADTDLAYQSTEYADKPTPEKKQKLFIGFYDAVAKFCPVIAYEVDDTVAAPTPTPLPAPNAKPFDSILANLNKPASAVKAATIVPTHRRLLSSACFTIIGRLEKTFPDSYLLPCTYKGFYSPQCQLSYKAQSTKKNSGANSSLDDQLGKF